MPISFGANSITGISVGNQSIAEAYVGSTKIWPEEPAYNHDWVWADENDLNDSSTFPGSVLDEPYWECYWTTENPNKTYAVGGYISNGYSNGDVDITVVKVVNVDEDYATIYEGNDQTDCVPTSVLNNVWGRYITAFATNESISAGQVFRVPSSVVKVVPIQYVPSGCFGFHNVYNQDDGTLDYWFALGSDNSNAGQMLNKQFYMTNGLQAFKGAFLNLAYNNINNGGYKITFNEPGQLLTTYRDMNWWTPAFGLMDTFQNWGTVASHIQMSSRGVTLTSGATATVYSHVDQGNMYIFPWRQNDQNSSLKPLNATVSGTNFTVSGNMSNLNLTAGLWYALFFTCGHNYKGFYEAVPMDWGTSTMSVFPVGVSSFVNIEP